MAMPKKISFMFEVSARCNHSCIFCYNAWKSTDAAIKNQLTTGQALNLLDKVTSEVMCNSISLSGGEPMMREDIFEIISFIKKRNIKVCLISNGTLLTREAIAKCINCGVDVFQITLLSHNEKLNSHLTGADGFEKVLDAILEIRKRNGSVHTFFVATADNINIFKEVMELNVMLGVQNVSFGRFIPGGSGLINWRKLMPEPGMIDEALEVGNEFSTKYPISVSVSTPILPCLNDLSRHKDIQFSFCSIGNEENAIFAINPEGKLKVCSHSPHILGNLLVEPFGDVLSNPFFENIQKSVPPFCIDCPQLSTCKGGCPSSAHVCSGSFNHEDPYLTLFKSKAVKPTSQSIKSSICE